LVILFGNSVQQAIDARKGIHLGRVKSRFNDLVFQIIWKMKFGLANSVPYGNSAMSAIQFDIFVWQSSLAIQFGNSVW
jgi:hypothetical protein